MASTVVIKDGLHTGANPATPTIGVVTAEDARLSNGAGFARLAAGLTVRTGVLYHGVQTLLAGTATTAPSMTVTVAPLAIVGQKASTEGVYVPTSTSTVLLDIAAAPGTNSRIDVVYAMQRDAGSATSPDVVTQGELGVATGTPAVSPVKPAIPVGAVEVGTVTVAAGATATTNASVVIATTCRWTVPLGAPIPVRSQSERDAIAAFDGLTVDRLDLDRTERSNGTVWAEPGAATFLRSRVTADYTLGSGVWQNCQNMALDGAIRGPAGVLSYAGGVVTILQAGLYRLSLQITAVTLTGTPAVQARLWNNTTTVYLNEWCPVAGANSFAISGSADVVLAAGALVVAAVYNAAGSVTFRGDLPTGTPTAFTVTRIPG